MPDGEFKIEKDVPIPPPKNGLGSGKGRSPLYPWAKMGVGDSILVRGAKSSASIYSVAKQWGERNGGRKFTCRKTSLGIRIWRTA